MQPKLAALYVLYSKAALSPARIFGPAVLTDLRVSPTHLLIVYSCPVPISAPRQRTCRYCSL